MKRVALATMAVSLVGLLSAGIAQAHNAKYGVEIGLFNYYEHGTIYPDRGVFGGQTPNGQPKCQAKRTVHVYSVETGALFGTDKTDNGGFFEVFADTPPAPGDYRAEVDKKTFGGDGHNHVCKPDKTPPVITVRD